MQLYSVKYEDAENLCEVVDNILCRMMTNILNNILIHSENKSHHSVYVVVHGPVDTYIIIIL